MRRTVLQLDTSVPILDDRGIVNNQFRTLLFQIYLNGLIIGTGSPEGVIEAQQGQEYMDEDGTAGSVKYIKQKADISGDRSQGWVAIG